VTEAKHQGGSAAPHRARPRSYRAAALGGRPGVTVDAMAVVVPENVGSWRVMEKAGMRYEGLADYYGMEGLKKYVAAGEWWSPPTAS
jgi:hypothetical protein